MAKVLVGKIFGVNSRQNYKMKPITGGRTIILCDSACNPDYELGKIVGCDLPLLEHRDFVDNSYHHWPIEMGKPHLNGQTKRAVMTASEDEIRDRLQHQDTTGISSLVVYDSDPHIVRGLPLIIISDGPESVRISLSKIQELTLGGCGLKLPNSYTGTNGLYGERFGSVRVCLSDLAREESASLGDVLLVPVERLSSGQYWDSVSINNRTLRCCVENAKIDSLVMI